MLERSWTTTAQTIVGRREPLGLLPIVPIALWTGAIALSGSLGYGVYQSLFGTNQQTFEQGWKDSAIFDQRMAGMHDLWLQFDRSVQLKCPGFLKKDGGRWWQEFKHDLNEFGAFYAATGAHSWALTGAPTPAQIAGALSHLESLVGWGQVVERDCPRTFPGMGIGLTPSEAEKVAEQQKLEDAKKDKGFFSQFGENFGVTLGIGVVGILGVSMLLNRLQQGPRGLSEHVPRRSPRRTRYY